MGKKARYAVPLAMVALLFGFRPAASSAAAGDATSEIDPAVYAAPGDLIEIEPGRRLNLRCIGDGAPAVVFEAGMGENSHSWRRVQGQVATFTKACSYDRAGFGYSDRGIGTATAADAVRDLRALLSKSKIATPVVLVGHSLGGVYTTLYADLHPDEVSGLVLIDPGYAGQFRQWYTRMSPAELSKVTGLQAQGRAELEACIQIARLGDKKELERANCFEEPVGSTPSTRGSTPPKYYEQLVAELTAFVSRPGELGETDRQELAAARNWGDMPLVVMTAGIASPSPNVSAETNEKATQDWREAHRALAARSTRGEWRIIPESGHSIQVAQADRVVTAIKKVVDAAK